MTRLLGKGNRGADVLRWQEFLASQAVSPGPLDGIFGPKTAAATRAFQMRHGLVVDGIVGPATRAKAAELTAELAPTEAPSAVIVLDPGHGGSEPVGGSSPNNAHAPSGVLEKELTLLFCQRLQRTLLERDPTLRLELTRTQDVNLSLADRARFGATLGADQFLSIHFNAFDGHSRGTEAYVRPIAGGNRNHAAEMAYAARLVNAVVTALHPFDAGARNRGVKEAHFGVLRDERLAHSLPKAATRACLLEVEFLDVPTVDELFTGARSRAVIDAVCSGLAEAMLEELAEVSGAALGAVSTEVVER